MTQNTNLLICDTARRPATALRLANTLCRSRVRWYLWFLRCVVREPRTAAASIEFKVGLILETARNL